jgi:hypothetical protein
MIPERTPLALSLGVDTTICGLETPNLEIVVLFTDKLMEFD